MKRREYLLSIIFFLLLINISSVFAHTYTIKEPLNTNTTFSLDTKYRAIAYYPKKEYYYVNLTWDDLSFEFKSFDEMVDNYEDIRCVYVENKSSFSVNVTVLVKPSDKLQITSNNANNLIFGDTATKSNLDNSSTASFFVKSILLENEKNNINNVINGEVKFIFTKYVD